MTTPKKPTRKARKPLYNYNEVTSYLEKLHKADFGDFANKFGGKSDQYQNFWHWIIDINDNAHNGSEIFLPSPDYLTDPNTPQWKKTILGYYYDFLGKDFEEPMWVEW